MEDDGESVVLVSSDEKCVEELSTSLASRSGMIGIMINCGFRESQEGKIHFPDIRGSILAQVIQFLRHDQTNETSKTTS